MLQQSNVKDITDNNKFWKTIKPHFPDKTRSAFSITLKENKKIVENQNEDVNIFNDYFLNVVSSFQIPGSKNINVQSEGMPCPELNSIMKYRRHSSNTICI